MIIMEQSVHYHYKESIDCWEDDDCKEVEIEPATFRAVGRAITGKTRDRGFDLHSIRHLCGN